jgi:hypothetical protein
MPNTLHKVSVTINQQQAELLDRLIADGELGGTYADVIKHGFLRYCDEHPEAMEQIAVPRVRGRGATMPARYSGPPPGDREESARP